MSLDMSSLYSQSKSISNQITSQLAMKKHLTNEQKNKKRRVIDLNKKLEEHMTASSLLEKSTQTARESGKMLLESTVSSIVQMVFGDDYEIEIQLGSKRNAPVAEVYIKKRIGLEDQLINVDHEGGGIRDVISLAFFAAICKITGDDNAAIITMDEPTPAVSAGHAKSVAEAIQLLMSYLDKQSVIITHEREFLPTMIDTVYFVQQSSDGVSKVDML